MKLSPGMRIWRCSINYNRLKSKARVKVTSVSDGYVWTEDGLRYSESTLKLNMPGDGFFRAGFYDIYWLEV
jgi:hypothetical protein